MKIKFIGMMMLACLMASCGKSVKVDTEEISGLLEGTFTVVPGEYEVSKEENGDYTITLPVKRTQESVPYTDAGIGVFGDPQQALVLAGFGYECYDEEGNKIGAVEAKDNGYDNAGQLAVLKLAPGGTGELKIKFENGNAPASLKLTTGLQFVSTGDVVLTGAIGEKAVREFILNLNFQNSTATARCNFAQAAEGVYADFNGKVVKTELAPGIMVFDIELADAAGNFGLDVKLVRDGNTEPYYYSIYDDVDSNGEQDMLFNMKSQPLQNK